MSRLLPALSLALLLAACGGGDSLSSTPGTPDPDKAGRLFVIEPGPDATTEMVLAMIDAKPGDVIEFTEGYFELTSGIQLSSTENVRVRGAGKDKTVLSFKNSTTQEGLLATNVRGIWVEDLTVLDPPGDAFKLQGVNFGTLSRVRAIWSSGRKTDNEDTINASNYTTKMQVGCNAELDDYETSTASGRYGIYPVNSQNILVEDTESIGASDAGIYVGQTDNAIIRTSRAAYNVFGFEIENVRRGEYSDNLAECNTGGFLIYDLDGLTRYGSETRMFRNLSRNNNVPNFAEPGSIVSNVPAGSGMITLAYDKIDIFDNTFEDNGTAGIIHTSYELFGDPGDRRLDMYTEAVHIWNNTFRNNGNKLPPPDLATILATGGEQITSVFPLIVGLKNLLGGGGYNGGHIIWDGYSDEYDADCPYPTDANGQAIPADADGKPIQGNQYPNPSCRYNQYKFDDEHQRIKPEWWFSCIDADNHFSDDSLTFSNFHGLDGLELVLALPNLSLEVLLAQVAGLGNFPADLDMSAHQCVEAYGRNMPPLAPVVIPPYTPSGDIDPAPTDEEVKALCEASTPTGQINEAAYKVNCPTLDQYHLFADAEDPTSAPNGRGVPYVLNSKLFTDYSVKYRVAFLPEGQQAIYKDGNDGENAAILFPVGTIIAKTFSFPDETAGTETPAETRLLIKRQRADGKVYWDGLEYVWAEENGHKVARLTQQGGTASVHWDYHDVDSNVLHTGSTNSYTLPNANQCLSCHANDDAETGTAPIGPKPRNMNRAYATESPFPSGQASHPVAGANQILWWCQNGLLSQCPEGMVEDPVSHVVTTVEHNAIFNVPGSSGYPAGSDADIEARVRSYLEVNCAHCHNPRGLAQNTGYYLDVFRAVNATYGICKGPTASGTEGRGGREHDIVPGSAEDSILPYRIGPEATTLAARMPPLARSTVHTEAFDLITQWINNVVDENYEDAENCVGGGGLFGGPLGG